MNINDIIAFLVSSIGTLVGFIVLFLLFGGWILALVGATLFSSFLGASPSEKKIKEQEKEPLPLKEGMGSSFSLK
ncbi:hypothetical protein A7Q09_05825 [Methylacidiphilum sp. Yel]|uniref:hypothetical protein n=1 Tax=Methylacidiphilum sp. Yel TaxID=1847730 RepID=UPI0010697B44|nr:hypothetical protein [Methylacidiphilum sp. Yel]TFE69212.1 hypothetical protein A7Q09_05825 [Methylacidiphilum sp. Yel]